MSGIREVREHRIPANGLQLSVFEWPADGPVVFLSHATGFHARCWDQVVERVPAAHCFAIDMRGHGRSSKSAEPDAYNWMNFGMDVAAVLRALDIRDALGVGHSKGGHALVTAFPQAPGAFSSLLLVDPVIQPRERYQPRPDAGGGEHFAARRRNEWLTWEEMRDRFASRPPFSLWQPEILRDYCEFGLLPAPSGEGYVLACPPEVEAATYAGAATADPYPSIAQVDVPVRILRAREQVGGAGDMSGSPTLPTLVELFANATDESHPELTHFIPMEAPDLVARHIMEMLEAGE